MAAAILAGALLVAPIALHAGSAQAAGASVAPRTLGPGDHHETLTVGGLARSFVLHVPPTPGVANRPLLLVYHGRGDTAQSTEAETDFREVADQTGEVVAFLQGVDDRWNEQAEASCPARSTTSPTRRRCWLGSGRRSASITSESSGSASPTAPRWSRTSAARRPRSSR